MKKNKKKNIKKKLFRNIFIGLTSILLIFLSYVLIVMNLIPVKYIILLVGSLIVLGLIICILLFRFKKLWVKVISIVYSVIVIGIIGFSLFVASKASNIIDVLTNTKYQTIGYSIIVLKDSSDDINLYNHKSLGIIKDIDYFVEINRELGKVIDFKVKKSDNLADLMDSLISGNVKCILLENSYLDVLEESDASVMESVKVIYSFGIKVKLEDIQKSVDVSLEPFTILISGIDTAGPIKTRSRSDVNIIMAVNPKTYEIALVHIPRDYYVEFHGLGTKDKLTHSGIYGIDMTVSTVEDFMDTDINYYVRINFSTFIKLIDLIGDIEIYNPVEFTSSGTHFDSGNITLNSKDALIFARTRKVLKGGDSDRGKNQERVLDGIIKKMSVPNITKNAYNIMDVMSDSFVTNLSSDEIRDLINFELNHLPNWKVSSYSVSGKGMMTKGTPFYPNKALYVMNPDTNTIEAAKAAINAVIGLKEE